MTPRLADCLRATRGALSAACIAAAVAGCGEADTVAVTADSPATAATAASRPAPRYPDGTVRFDRAPGEKGYWGPASVSSLFERGQDIEFDSNGLLRNPQDASRVAPFRPWALALYRYRQANGLADDPAQYCISPAGPRHMHTPPGFRIIQDTNNNRVYVLFGGGNRVWRVIYMDGRVPPDPAEVVGTYFGYSTGEWQGDTFVVESSGFNERFWFSQGGLPHTASLRLTERFSRPDRDTLKYEVTVDDPLTYTRPWTAEWTVAWVDGGEMAEQFCEE